MPIYRNRTVLEIARSLRAFLSLDVGITRGAVPDLEVLREHLEQAQGRLDQLRKQLSNRARQIEQMQERLSDKNQRMTRLRPAQPTGASKARTDDISGVRLSIVIPTYNRVELLKRAVESALRQDGSDDYEVLVVDDCSDDDTWDYLQNIKNPKLRILRNSQRLSMGPNWNKAVRSSKGEFVFVLQDDDLVLPGLLEAVSSTADRYENVDLICFATCLMDENERTRRTYWHPESEELLLTPEALMRFARKWTISSGQIIFSRATFDLHGAFNIATPIMSDAEAILRWMVHCNTVLIPEVLALRRTWRGQVTNVTHHTTEMTETMTYVVTNVLNLAANSGRLDAAQLDDLRLALTQTFVEPFKEPRDPDQYLREAIPQRHGGTA